MSLVYIVQADSLYDQRFAVPAVFVLGDFPIFQIHFVMKRIQSNATN